MDIEELPESKVEDAQQDAAEIKDDWKKITNGKYKSEAELARAHKELETKLSELGTKVKQSEDFATIINPLLEEIRNDPEIFNKLDKRLREKNDPKKENDNDSKSTDKATEEIRSITSDLILNRFETKYGINKLPPDEQKEMRQIIGDAILDLTGQRLNAIDLRRLNTVLENAYVIANKSKLIDESKLNPEASDDISDGASFSSLPSSNGKKGQQLSPEEAKVAEKLGLTREQYVSGKKK